MELLTKEESYADRRQLFKNIWDTAMHIEDRDGEILNKPKVIKTLRLDEVDRCVVGKTKKQRIRNLRTVCRKILDFCDRQEADDVVYEQMAVGGQEPSQHNSELPRKTKGNNKFKKNKMKRAKSLFAPTNEHGPAKTATSERKDDFMSLVKKTSRNTSPIKFKQTAIMGQSLIINTTKNKINPRVGSSARPRVSGSTRIHSILGDISPIGQRKKTAKKKHIIKRKHLTEPPGSLDWPEP